MGQGGWQRKWAREKMDQRAVDGNLLLEHPWNLEKPGDLLHSTLEPCRWMLLWRGSSGRPLSRCESPITAARMLTQHARDRYHQMDGINGIQCT